MMEDIILVLLAILAVLSNAVIVIMYFQQQCRKRKASATFLCSQAVADCQAGAILVPLVRSANLRGKSWISYLTCFVFYAGLLNRVVIALDRYIAANQPLKYKILLSRKRVKSLLLAVWLVSFLLAIIPIGWEYTEESLKSKATMCYLELLILITCLLTIGALLLNFMTYLTVKRFLQSKADRVKRYQKNLTLIKTAACIKRKMKRATFQFYLLTAVFSLIYLPVICINIAQQVQPELRDPGNWLLIISLYLFGVYAFINPIISLWYLRDLKLAVKTSFRDLAEKWKVQRFSGLQALNTSSEVTRRAEITRKT